MNGLDWGLIVGLLLSAALGLLRGFVREALDLASWFAAGLFAYLGWPFFRSVAQSYIQNPMLADWAGGLGGFVILLAVFSIISHLLSSLVHKSTTLGSIDRALGFGFGVIRACVIIFAAELAFQCFYPRAAHPEVVQNSRFRDFIYQGGDTLFSVLPDKARTQIKTWQDNVKPAPEKDGGQNGNPPKPADPLATLNEAGKVLNNLSQLADLKPKVREEQPAGEQDGKPKQYSDRHQAEMERVVDQT